MEEELEEEEIIEDAEEEQEDKLKNKSIAVQARWDKQRSEEALAKNGDLDRRSKRFDYKCFDGMHLSAKQKEFVVRFMDPPYLGKKENRFKAYGDVFTASNQNSLKANCTALLGKSKIKEAIIAYQAHSLKNHKIEVTSESIENLRRRANYSIRTFYKADGDPIELDQIDPEWLVCIDNIEVDYKINGGIKQRIVKYKLCDRERSAKRLEELLGVYTEMQNLQVSVPLSQGKNVIDSAEEKKETGPRIIMNFSVGAGSE